VVLAAATPIAATRRSGAVTRRAIDLSIAPPPRSDEKEEERER